MLMGYSEQRRLSFPKDFLWGTASSSYQCEGGNTQNQWYRWEQQGHILSGEHCGRAANWWHAAEDDFAFAEQMENNALRLSLEWSRIEPQEGVWDSAALERYREMLLDLHRRHMVPIVTLHHFTDPLWFVERGSFTLQENVSYFVRYVEHVVAALGDLCTFWVTLNEPNSYAFQGYLFGAYPPGEQDLGRAFTVLRNLLQAHVAAFYLLRERSPQAKIGYCLRYHLFEPLHPHSMLDVSVARIQEQLFNWSILRAGESGRFSFPMGSLLAEIPGAVGARDYHGVNYYTRDRARLDPRRPKAAVGRRFMRANMPRTDPGLDEDAGEIYPYGLYRVLSSVYQRTRGNKPIYITENGFSDRTDDHRPAAILAHLAMVHKAIREGIPVCGYLHWSLTDNFAWNNGWSVRFGLIEVDPVTQIRVPRRSASMYGEICRANAITEEIVYRYAPEIVDTIFGPVDQSLLV